MIDHKFYNESKNSISSQDTNLETEEQQKQFIKDKVSSDPFRTTPSNVHFEMHDKTKGTLGNILTMQKTREIFHNAKNKMLFSRVDIENIRYYFFAFLYPQNK